MDSVLKQALKDLLHLIVDKEEDVVLKDVMSKLPAPWASMAGLLVSAAEAQALAAQDKAIDQALK